MKAFIDRCICGCLSLLLIAAFVSCALELAGLLPNPVMLP